MKRSAEERRLEDEPPTPTKMYVQYWSWPSDVTTVVFNKVPDPHAPAEGDGVVRREVRAQLRKRAPGSEP